MKAIRIKIEDNIEDIDAVAAVYKVISMGKISLSNKKKQYCFVSETEKYRITCPLYRKSNVFIVTKKI